MANKIKSQAGLSLIEAIAAIVIMSICLGGIIRLMGDMMLSSARVVEERQALLVASSYMEEIMSKPTNDPVTGLVCGSPPASRSLFMKVCDYNGLVDNGAHDQFGNAITGLGNYVVSVNIGYNIVGTPSAAQQSMLPQLKYGYLGLPGPYTPISGGAKGQWSYLSVQVNVSYVSNAASPFPDFSTGLSSAKYIFSSPPYYSPFITASTVTPPVYTYP